MAPKSFRFTFFKHFIIHIKLFTKLEIFDKYLHKCYTVKSLQNRGFKVSNNDNIVVGKYNPEFNKKLNLNITAEEIVRSKGLPTHLIKHGHHNCLKYIDYISDIIENPDYIGVNPNEKGESLELVKRYKNNILIGLKVDSTQNNLYVSTMYEVQQTKLERRIFSNRLVPFSED